MAVDLEKQMRHGADFITQREIKVCLNCGWPYSTMLKSCPKCHDRAHTKTLLIVATWKQIPEHLRTDGSQTSTSHEREHGRSGPGVRVTNIGGNAV